MMTSDIDELRVFQQAISAFDCPAFVRRARECEAAWEQLLERCRRQREEWLQFPKLWLGVLFALIDESVPLLSRLVGRAIADELAALHACWQPALRMPVSPTDSLAQLRRELRQVGTSFARFNSRWERFVNEMDLAPLNALRDGYNRYYVLEKECAVRSAFVARAGFTPLSPATAADLWRCFPPLPTLTLLPVAVH